MRVAASATKNGSGGHVPSRAKYFQDKTAAYGIFLQCCWHIDDRLQLAQPMNRGGRGAGDYRPVSPRSPRFSFQENYPFRARVARVPLDVDSFRVEVALLRHRACHRAGSAFARSMRALVPSRTPTATLLFWRRRGFCPRSRRTRRSVKVCHEPTHAPRQATLLGLLPMQERALQSVH